MIEINTSPGRQARSRTLLYYLKLQLTTAGPAYPGFQRGGGGGGGGGLVLQVRPGTISGGWGERITIALRIQSPCLKSTPPWCNFVYQLYTVHPSTSEIGIDLDINHFKLHFTSKCTN